MSSDGNSHSDNPFDPLRKAHENEFFTKQNRELAQKLKARLDLKKAGVADEGLINQLLEAGFDSDSVRALIFIPLIQVAWADNKLQNEERAEIKALMEKRGIQNDSKAAEWINKWLERKPTDALFQRGLVFVEPIVSALKTSGQDQGQWILDAAAKVAEAAGGLYGLRHEISKEEAEILRNLGIRLGRGA